MSQSRYSQYSRQNTVERLDSRRSRQLVSRSSPCLLTGRQKKHIKRVTYHIIKKDAHTPRIIKANADRRDPTRPYLLYESGINITPKALTDAEFSSREVSRGLPGQMPLGRTKLLELRSIDSQQSTATGQRSLTSLSMTRFSVRKSIASQHSINMSIASIDVFSRDEISFVAAIETTDIEEEETLSARAPSMFRLREDPPPKTPVFDPKFKIDLVETDTMFLLQLTSQSDSPETEYGKEISEMNDAYDRSLEKNKALSTIAVQTTKVFKKHRRQYITRHNRCNRGAYATVWDMYDTYENLATTEQDRQSITTLSERKEGKVEKIVVTDEEKEYENTFTFCGQIFSRRFLNALMVVDRLINKGIHRENQLNYQGLLVQDPFSTDVKYNYTLTHLWTFYCDHIRNRCVTSMSWNSKNKNILAVGYGKFKFSTKCDGLVCIWNVKNPSVPERRYDFPHDPVTFVTFSNFRWHILAVTFYSGSVLLIDIVARTLLVKANNHHYPRYFPVKQARWFPRDHRTTILITCGKGGRVFRYKKNEFFLSNKIMTLGRPHGKIHGVEQPRKCFARKVLARRQPAAEVLVQHPMDPQLYLVGSSEGCVYICSVQHRHDYKEIFYAHNGPVYNIQFNPFCSKVFLTCGADWCIRIWADSVYQPLITLENGMTAVQDALWSPLHSTVIVSTTGSFVEIWDIRRRISKPMSSTETPSRSQNNLLKFSHNKFNICVGDLDGNVHVMALAEMPFSPSYQETVLIEAIYAALVVRPEVLNILRKLGPPFVSRGQVDDYRSKLYRRLNRLHEDVL